MVLDLTRLSLEDCRARYGEKYVLYIHKELWVYVREGGDLKQD
jgi:hypothetical protein